MTGHDLPGAAHTEGRIPQPSAVRYESRLNWVPIRSLAARHGERMREHLLSLEESDRCLRFGYAASDDQVSRYVERVDFERDEAFGIFNRRLELIAMAHLAYLPEPDLRMAEFGVSVLPKARGRSYGARLFNHAALHARNRGVETLVIHALSENGAMLRIAANAGATVQRAGADSEALLRLPPQDIASHVEQLMEDSAAEFDYRWKLRARQMWPLLDTVTQFGWRLTRPRPVRRD